MNDNDIREMFHRRESDVTLQGPPPGAVLRRARRRQVRTLFVAATIVVALIAIPLAGLRLRGGRADQAPMPANGGPVELPTAGEGFGSAALPYASIAYPDGWFLTDASPLASGTTASTNAISTGPVLQLSSFDPDLHASPLCVFDGNPIPDDGVLLTVGVQSPADPAPPIPTGSWPVDLGPYPSGMSPSCDQGVDLLAGWVAPSGVAYWANATIGKDASDADRSALETAFASMLFPPTDAPWMSSFSADQGQGSPRLILDSTTFQGVPLNLVAYLDHYKTLWIGVSAPIGNPYGGTAAGVGTGSGPPNPTETTESSTLSGAVVFGDVALDVARVEINTQEARNFPATIVPLPANIGADRNAVWGFVDGPTQSTQTIGYDAAGNILGVPIVTTAPPDVVASGTDPEGGAWTLSITHETTGDGLAFYWATGAGGGGCCLGPQKLHGPLQLDGTSGGTGEPSVITAFASTEVARIVARFPGGSFDGQLIPFPPKFMGPAQVVVVFVSHGVPMSGGDLIAFDAAGNELGRVSLG